MPLSSTDKLFSCPCRFTFSGVLAHIFRLTVASMVAVIGCCANQTSSCRTQTDSDENIQHELESAAKDRRHP